MIITAKNIAKRNKVVLLEAYSPDVEKQIALAWNFKREGTLTHDLYTKEENFKHGDILQLDITEQHEAWRPQDARLGSGFAYIYYSNDTQHYLQRKKIYANTKGLYIELDGRTYLNLRDVEIT